MNNVNKKYSVGLVDDHKLIRKGLAELISSFDSYHVVLEASNGIELIELLKSNKVPDILLVDIHMKEMDGFQTMEWIKAYHPTVKAMALSMYDKEDAIIKMLKLGARGYLLKDAEPYELLQALDEIVSKEYYHSELTTGAMHNLISSPSSAKKMINDRELEFIRYAASDFTYKEIADKMCVAARTVDGYREDLFAKLQVKSRVSLVLFAVRSGIIDL